VPDQPLKPLVLAIDTTSQFGSLALACGANILAEWPLEAPTGFAHVLFAHLERLLTECGVRLPAIDCFAAASGPGSFTGVRVGLACVKGLAEALGKPAAGISNLQALACFGTAPLRATVIDARRGEVYGALYDDAAQLVMPEVVAGFSTWAGSLPEQGIEFVSSDFAPFREALAHTGLAAVPVRTAPRALAGAVARLAAASLLRGETLDPAALDANYVRRSDAELFWKD